MKDHSQQYIVENDLSPVEIGKGRLIEEGSKDLIVINFGAPKLMTIKSFDPSSINLPLPISTGERSFSTIYC